MSETNGTGMSDADPIRTDGQGTEPADGEPGGDEMSAGTGTADLSDPDDDDGLPGPAGAIVP